MRGEVSDPGDSRGGESRSSGSWRTRLWGTLRAGALLTVILVFALGALLGSAEARAGEALLGFGAELFEWQGAQFHTSPRRLTVNGLELRLVTASTDLPVPDVLDRFEGLCRKKSGVAMPTGVKLALPAAPLDGVLRSGSEREGVVACADTNGPLELLDIAPRIERLASTGDLSELGELRYFIARRSGNTTTVIALWTEGGAPLLKMFPQTGDAPGRDPEDVPRPENVQRLLTAAEHAAPYSVTLYRANSWRPDALLNRYVDALRRGGWSVDSPTGGKSVVAHKGIRTIAVTVSRTKAGRTVASVTELS